MQRRKLLSYSLGSAALLCGAIASLSFQSTQRPATIPSLTFLDEEYYAILYAIAQTLLPANPPFPAASEISVAKSIDAVLFSAQPEVQDQILQVLWLIENPSLSIFLSFHHKPFSQSSPEERTQILEDWRTSSILDLRSAFKALNGLCNAAYYAHPRVSKLTGYDGPPQAIVTMRKARGY